MTKEYQRLLEDVTNATNKAEAVRALAKIVVDKSGRAFILGLDPKAAKLCVETLDYVSRDPRLCFPLSSPHVVMSGHHRAQPRNRREGSFLHHVEKACRAPRTTARSRGDKRKHRDAGQHYRLRWVWRRQVWKVQGRPRRGEDREGCKVVQLPEDTRGEY